MENKKRWLGKNIDETQAKALAVEANIPLSISKLLIGMEITTKEKVNEFLNPNYINQIHNPMSLLDMEKAVERINKAIDNGEKILGHGDYDCDGVTTTSLLKEGFRLLGVEIDVYAPNRFKDGYGINPKNAKKFSSMYDLIISGDTGIRAFESAKILKDLGGADLIVTDHHEPFEGHLEEYYDIFRNKMENDQEKVNWFNELSIDEKFDEMKKEGIIPSEAIIEVLSDKFIALPDAFATIDPQRLGDPYPCKTLAGVAVVFKLLQALFISRKMNPKTLFYFLDLVATGCIADLAQQIDRKDGRMDFEVRTMCKFGIDVMNARPKPWVKALKEVQTIKGDITSGHIGFRIGPVLNAPGRLEDPMPAVELLLEKDEEKARKLASDLRNINSERQEQTKEYEQVIEELQTKGKEYYDFGIVVQSDAFHIGIAGLVAGKLCEAYYRPSIALAPIEKEGEVVLKGSARSIPGVHVLRMLDKVKEKIGDYEYGGHEQAAGMTLRATETQTLEERFEAFRVAFREACMEHDAEIFTPCVNYDAEVEFVDISFDFIELLKKLEPFGEGNRRPLFRANNVKISNLKGIMEGKGVRFTFKQDKTILNGIMFKDGEFIIPEYQKKLMGGEECMVDLLFHPEINRWNGNSSIQLQIQDVKFH